MILFMHGRQSHGVTASLYCFNLPTTTNTVYSLQVRHDLLHALLPVTWCDCIIGLLLDFLRTDQRCASPEQVCYFVNSCRHLLRTSHFESLNGSYSCFSSAENTCLNTSYVARKPVFGVSDHVRHKAGYTTTKDRQRLEISDLGSRGFVLSM